MKRNTLSILKMLSKIDKSISKKIIRSDIAKSGVWFVDIPRTGSTSLRHDLMLRFGPCFSKNFHMQNKEEIQKSGRKNHVAVEAHATAQEIRKLIGSVCYDSVYKFAFVRNPLDRFYSLFHYRQIVGDIDKRISFKRYACSLTTPRFRDPNTPFFKRPYYLSMCDYLLDDRDCLAVDEWFKFEERAVSLGEIGDKIGIQFSETHLASGKSLESYSDLYDSESAECVRAFYKDDFEYFAYND